MKSISALLLILSIGNFALANSNDSVVTTIAASSGKVATSDTTTAEANSTEATELAAPTVPTNSGIAGEESIVMKAEKDIAVQLEPVKKDTPSESSTKMFLGLAVLGVLAAGGIYLVNKFRRTNLKQISAPEIKILRQHHLGPKKALAIIRVAGESILIGITDHNINMIKSLSLLDEDVPEDTPVAFNKVMQRFAPSTNEDLRENGKSQQASMNAAQNSEENEDFSISGIKDFVSSRLKNMRNLE